MAESHTNGIDLLHGPLAGSILKFAIPLALTGVLQQLFNAADVAVVGRFAGTEAMAAVGSSAPVISLMVNLFIGISLGANVVISTAIGRGDRETVCKAVHTSVLFSLAAGFCMAVAGLLITKPLLIILAVPDSVMVMAAAYLRIYMLGLPAIFLYNFESAVFRGSGDTRTPFICLFCSGILNIIGNLFFVIVCKMTASGVALATILSNFASSLVLFILLVRRWDLFQIQNFRIHVPVLKNMLQIGIPAGLQGIVFPISNLCIQSAVNSLGEIVMAASSAAIHAELLVYMFISSFGHACTTFTGQNIGAEQYDRCRRTLKVCLIEGGIGTAVIVACILIPGHYYMSFFNDNPSVIQYGLFRMRILLCSEWVRVVLEVFSGCLRGHGLAGIPSAISIAGICGFRILWVFTVFRAIPDFGILMSAYPISWSITAVAIVYYYFRKRNTLYLKEGVL